MGRTRQKVSFVNSNEGGSLSKASPCTSKPGALPTLRSRKKPREDVLGWGEDGYAGGRDWETFGTQV